MRSFPMILCFLFFSAVCARAEDLVIAVGIPVGSPLFGYWEDLFREVETRSEGALDIQLESMTLARARRSLLDGSVDGDAGRTVYVYENEKGIIKVEPPLFTNSYYLIGKEGLEFNSPEDLTKYKLATIRGNAVLSRYARDNNLDTLFVNENEDALRMILYDRVDCFLATDLESPMMEEEEFKEKGLIMYPDVIFQIGIYLFLSESKQSCVPLIENILTELDREGNLEAYLRGEG